VCFKFSLNICENFLILKERAKYDPKCIFWCSCKELFIAAITELDVNFFDRFSNNNLISNFMDFLPVGAEFFHGADEQTDGSADGNYCVFRIRLL
jgi:hypothetical protein